MPFKTHIVYKLDALFMVIWGNLFAGKVGLPHVAFASINQFGETLFLYLGGTLMCVWWIVRIRNEFKKKG